MRFDLGASNGQLVDHHQLLLLRPQRQGRSQRGLLHLLGQGVFVAAWMRTEHFAAADEIGRAGRALAGIAGSLLSVRLPATATNVHSRFRRVRSCALGCLLSLYGFPQQLFLHLGGEDLVGQIHLADFLSF
jgi:hypothetical protein